MHYTALIDRYKGDIAHTWQVLNEITGKRKQSELCDTFNINNIPTNDANTISNHFVITLLILDNNVPQQ